MTAAPVMSITDELVAELEAAASYCVTEVIRSHPWSEQDFDLLRADERYVRAASPELVRALLAERAELKRDAERYLEALQEVANHVDGNIRPTVRDCVNGMSCVQDIYDYCDQIDSVIDAAMQAAQ